jgi:ribosomal subunit interface protein
LAINSQKNEELKKLKLALLRLTNNEQQTRWSIMQLAVKGKQMDVGDSLRSHVETTLGDLVGKYFSHAVDGHVTFSREAHQFRADIVVHVGKGIVLQSQSLASDAYPAFNSASERLVERLRRYSHRLKDHHAKARDDGALAQSFILSGTDATPTEAENDNPVIIAEMTTAIETLSVSEAVMRMDLAEAPALLFRNSKNNELNMIYRRNDGHIGWVDPANNKKSA